MTTLKADFFPSSFLAVYGSDRVALLQRLSTNDLTPLQQPHVSLSTVFTDDRGKTIDWVWIVSLKDRLLLRASADRAEHVAEWISRYTIMEDVRSETLSGKSAWQCIGVFGDDELKVDVGVARVVQGQGVLLRGIAATADGVEIWLPATLAQTMLSAIQNKGAWGLDPDGYEGWRIRLGLPSIEHECSKPINPLELCLDASIGWNKGCYIGQEVISRLDSYDKVARRLVGFWAPDPPSAAFEEVTSTLKLRQNDKTVGRVTSILKTSDGKARGLAVVERAALPTGTHENDNHSENTVQLIWPEGEVSAHLVNTPFAQVARRARTV